MKATLIAIVSALALAGCATESTTRGTAWGAGLGAVAGGIYGGHGSDALIGAAIGAGVGYLIGNEQDKKKAQQMSEQSRSSNYSHNETGPFAGTSWRLQDWSPKEGRERAFQMLRPCARSLSIAGAMAPSSASRTKLPKKCRSH